MRTPTRTHKHTNTYAAVFLALTLSPIWNSHSAMSSDSNESASTNARLTDFVAMLLLLLVLEIDGNDKWRQRDVATTSTHRQLTRQSHSTAAQQAAQAWNIKRGSFAVAVTVTDAALLSTFASSQIHAYVHTNTRAWWTSRMRVCVCQCAFNEVFSGGFFVVENFTSRHTQTHTHARKTEKRLWFSDNFKVEVWSNRCQSHNWVCAYVCVFRRLFYGAFINRTVFFLR